MSYKADHTAIMAAETLVAGKLCPPPAGYVPHNSPACEEHKSANLFQVLCSTRASSPVNGFFCLAKLAHQQQWYLWQCWDKVTLHPGLDGPLAIEGLTDLMGLGQVAALKGLRTGDETLADES